jgi:hypothetical protein
MLGKNGRLSGRLLTCRCAAKPGYRAVMDVVGLGDLPHRLSSIAAA